MRVLDLFSGIGGFALAARWMGWETVQFVDIDGFCQKVLKKNFPNVPIHGDIKTFNGTGLRGTVDLITGGFPCQPFSSAGKRRGTDDDRYLWPEMLRIIREVQPAYLVGENVYGIVNWSKGLVFEQVCADLENEGYQMQPVILPACAVDAPHRRDRVWFVAYSKGNDDQRAKREFYKKNGRQNRELLSTFRGTGKGLCIEGTFADVVRTEEKGNENDRQQVPSFGKFPTQSPVRSGNDGLPTGLVRYAIKGAGNAIVPQVAYEIFKAIEITRKGVL